MKDNKTVRLRIKKDKELLIEQLKKTPIVQLACEKVGVGRATYYRWKVKDKSFSKKAEIALAEGSLLINDMAESQLLSAIMEKNITAIIFWLKHHHPTYETRIAIKAVAKDMDEKLTKKQAEVVRRALEASPCNSLGGGE
jgi:hypothetical protein